MKKNITLGFGICMGVSLIVQIVGYRIFSILPESFYRGAVGSANGVLWLGLFITVISVLLRDYFIMISYTFGFVIGYIVAVLFGAEVYDDYGLPVNGLDSWMWHLLIISVFLTVGVIFSIISRVRKQHSKTSEI